MAAKIGGLTDGYDDRAENPLTTLWNDNVLNIRKICCDPRDQSELEASRPDAALNSPTLAGSNSVGHMREGGRTNGNS